MGKKLAIGLVALTLGAGCTPQGKAVGRSLLYHGMQSGIDQAVRNSVDNAMYGRSSSGQSPQILEIPRYEPGDTYIEPRGQIKWTKRNDGWWGTLINEKVIVTEEAQIIRWSIENRAPIIRRR